MSNRRTGYARCLDEPRSGDDGFTLIELVIALTLFMIIFAAIMTFSQANMISSAYARTRAQAVNVASSYIEQVRALPYTAVGTPSNASGPSGTLAEQTFTQAGITFHLVPTVTWVDDPTITGSGGPATTQDYKRVVVTVTATAGDGSSALGRSTYSLETYVSRAGGDSQPTALPSVEFDNSSPLSGQYYSGTIHVGATAQANQAGALIDKFNMYADDQPQNLLIGVGGMNDVASWPPRTGSYDFMWATASVNDSGTPNFDDGPYNLTLQVFDNLSKVAFLTRASVYIINHPPSVPSVGLLASSATTEVGSWNVCGRNGISAARYEWEIYDQLKADPVSNAINYDSWINSARMNGSGSTTGTTVTTADTGHSFDRHLMRVRSISHVTANNPSGFMSGWGMATVIGRPALNSLMYENVFSPGNNDSQNDWSTTIRTPALPYPEFPYNTSTYSVQYYRTAAAGGSTLSTATAVPITLPFTFATTNQKYPNTYYYIAKVTVTPTVNPPGAPSGPVSVWSNWLGPNGYPVVPAGGTGSMTTKMGW